MEPKIRFKGYCGEWDILTLGDVGVFRSSGVDKKINSNEKIINLLNYMDVYNMRKINANNCTDLMQVSATDKQIKECTIEEGDIFFTPTSETAEDIGHVMVIEERLPNTCYSYHLMRFRPNLGLFAKLFPNWGFQTSFVKKQMFIGAKGVQRMVLGRSVFESLKVMAPSIQEQQAIASYFQQLDSLIQSTSKKIESLKQVKVASLQSMFPQEGKTKPSVRFKGFEGNWEKVMVGKMGTTYSGLSGKVKQDFDHGDAKFVTFLNVLTNAKIDISILEPVNVCKGEHQNEVKKGDLLFNTSSETPEEVGMCAVMDDELENVYLNSFCFGFRITDENITPIFVAYLMRSHIGRGIMSILAQGATRYNLSKNNFCKMDLLLPKTKAEQVAIGNYFINLDTQISLQTQRLEKLKQIKSACLDNMFV